MSPCAAAEISATLRALTALAMSLDDQIHHIEIRARETGGAIKLPQRGNTWDNQRHEITLHGIFADGEGWSEVIRNWQRAARMAATGVAS
jgi:hypothetical protein